MVVLNKVRIRSKVPVYVAGLDRGVRPMGLWSMLITLSMCWVPVIRSWARGRSRAPISFLARALYRMSLIRVLLPLPLTPVTTVRVPRGMDTSMSFKLLARAPLMVSFFPLPFRRWAGTGIFFRPLRY